jgi:serine/threonine-protein kinase
MPWAVAGALGVGLATVVTLWAPWRAAPQRAPWRLSVELGADTSLATDAGTTNPLAANVTSIVRSAALALPPDGSTLAFTGRKDAAGAVTQLYLRRLDQLQPTALSGTDDALSPFFSPDGQWIAFFAGGKLKKVSVAGGAAVTLCDAPNGRGGWWAEDGTIIFSPDTSPGVRLWRVSSAGGKPEPLTTLGAGEVTHRWPQVLPGGKAILFMAHSSTGGYDNANLVVQPLPTGTPKVVQRGGFYGRYLRSSHLIFVRESTLFAVPFDLDRLEVVGQPVPVLEGVANNATAAALAEYAVADDGTFAYLPGRGVVNDVPISWMDRQ